MSFNESVSVGRSASPDVLTSSVLLFYYNNISSSCFISLVYLKFLICDDTPSEVMGDVPDSPNSSRHHRSWWCFINSVCVFRERMKPVWSLPSPLSLSLCSRWFIFLSLPIVEGWRTQTQLWHERMGMWDESTLSLKEREIPIYMQTKALSYMYSVF